MKKKKLLLLALTFIIGIGSWVTLFGVSPETTSAAECKATSALFSPYGNQTLNATGDSQKKLPVLITVNTENCAGKMISVSVSVPGECLFTSCDVTEINNLEFYVPAAAQGSQEKLTIEAFAGEGWCTEDKNPDCQYRIEVDTNNQGTNDFYSDTDNPESLKAEGVLSFDCDGLCELVGNNWYVASGNGLKEDGTKVYVSYTPDTNTIDPNSPCFKDGQYDPECYELISDIPLKDEEGNQIKYITNAQLAEGGLALTFNSFYKLLIGLASLIAVIMVIVAVIKYWSTDNISTKQLMKGRLTNIALGILLLVGMVVILGTINPDLLRVEPEISRLLVQVEQEAPKTSDRKPIITGGGKATGATDSVSDADADAGAITTGATVSTTYSNVTKNIVTYDSQLSAKAAKYGVSCTLLKADMYAESGGDPKAVSPTGARGLLQLMPSTAKALGYPNFDDMFVPEKNIDAGAKYWGALSKGACNGKKKNAACDASVIDYVIAAYNGGAGANKPSTEASCQGKTWWQCEINTGYKETRKYVQVVKANYQVLTQKNWGCSGGPTGPTLTTGTGGSNTGVNKKILFLGDSITVDLEGYAEQFKTAKPDWTVTKAAANGRDSAQLLQALQSLGSGTTYQAVVILIGTNDVYKGFSEQKSRTNLDAIYQLAHTIGAKVIAITPPADVWNTSPGAYANNPTDATKKAKFDAMRAHITSYQNISVIDFWDMTDDAGDASMFKDKIHPTKAAHAELLQKLLSIL